jgi:hypothetical protein
MSLDEMIAAEALPATEPPPQSLTPDPHPQLFVESKDEPELELRTKRLTDIEGAALWGVEVLSAGAPALPGVPGKRLEQVQLPAPVSVPRPGDDGAFDSYRPPWLDGEFLPRVAPRGFSTRGIVEQISKAWPWCTIGKVWCGFDTHFTHDKAGTAVLVGRDLILTASHMVPWGGAPGQWWMDFVPAFRQISLGPGADPFFGRSRVSSCLGVFVDKDVSAFDCAVCRLVTPLGDRCGWMGGQSWGDRDEYYDRSWISIGYPQSFLKGKRQAARFEVGVRDIDADGNGLEIETVDFTSWGWSGGPLWGFIDGHPRVIGVASGVETDDPDPQRSVFAGGKHMIDLVKRLLP